jgi:hypothetical protein
VVCLAPRAPGDSVRPRRLSGVGARPLNFAVRAHGVGLGVRRQNRAVKEASAKALFDASAVCALQVQ